MLEGDGQGTVAAAGRIQASTVSWPRSVVVGDPLSRQQTTQGAALDGDRRWHLVGTTSLALKAQLADHKRVTSPRKTCW